MRIATANCATTNHQPTTNHHLTPNNIHKPLLTTNRELLTERIKQTLRSPQCTGALARLRDEFGVDSPVTIDNTVTLLFAGWVRDVFDTHTSCSMAHRRVG